MRLVIDVDATTPRQKVQEIRERVESPRALLAQMGLLLEEYETDVFRSRGRGQWAPDDPATVQLKGSGRVLVDTGALLDYLTNARIEGESVFVNQGNAHYGAFLRDGDRGMPKRDPAPEPPHGVQQDWADKLLGLVVDGRSW